MEANIIEPPMAVKPGEQAQRKRRPRSAVTSGRKLLNLADPNSAFARRYHDLMRAHAADLGGADRLSEGQKTLIRRAASISIICEEMEAKLSAGIEIDVDKFTRSASHLRRILETLGLQRVSKDVTDIRTYLASKSGSGAP